MSISVHTANPHEVLTLPQAGGRLLRRSYDALGRPSELRLGEAGRAFLCFNGDPVRGIRRIDATPDSFKMEFAMGPSRDGASLCNLTRDGASLREMVRDGASLCNLMRDGGDGASGDGGDGASLCNLRIHQHFIV